MNRSITVTETKARALQRDPFQDKRQLSMSLLHAFITAFVCKTGLQTLDKCSDKGSIFLPTIWRRV